MREAEFQEVIGRAVKWRRELHSYPEVAFQERRTADFVASRLSESGLLVFRGLGGTGVIGTLRRGSGCQSLAIRADMDALPIEELTRLPYASRHAGVMHACGHDGHMAIALAAADLCSRLPDLDGVVHFIFQPAEENEGGAEKMISDGLFHRFPCDRIYALHNWPALPIGVCVVNDGAMMAAFDRFEIQVEGRGCHAAMPQEGSDPILAGCQIVTAMQSIVSRNVSPNEAAVVSITQIDAGQTWNVIPDVCHLRGTVRWLDIETGQLIRSRLEEVAKDVARGFGCESKFSYTRCFPPTINNPGAARIAREVAVSEVGLRMIDAAPSMGAEDFAFMLEQTPGCYLWLGSGGRHRSTLHSPCYDFNDDLISLGARLWMSLVQRSLRAPSA